jgi:hypothetical protein
MRQCLQAQSLKRTSGSAQPSAVKKQTNKQTVQEGQHGLAKDKDGGNALSDQK